MRRRLKKKPISFVKKNLILILGCFVLLSISTIGYSALNQALNISGDIAIRAVKDIRITDLELATSSEGGYEYYNSQYGTDSVTLSAVLPNVGSSITYETEITNKGTADMEVSELNANISSPLVARLSTLATTEYFDCSIEGLEEGDVIASGEIKTFRITISRIANSADNNKNVEATVGLEFKESLPPEPYTDPILVGNDPDLLNNSLTPIIYDETDKVWRVANIYDPWHDYTNQMWANAVILEDGVTKSVGDTVIVPTADSTATEVKAMYVWIPRYSYTIKSEDGTNYYGKTLSELGASTASQATPGAIDIKFENALTKETGTAQYTGVEANNWITHPAFTFENEELTGMWVGKFETSAKTTDDCYTYDNEQMACVSSAVSPYILPNVKSLRMQVVYQQFTTAQKFSEYLSDSTNIDSHMMKNSEWGAVAYLSQSIYGKYGNSMYTGVNKEVYQNDSSAYYTGRSGGAPSSASYSATGACYYDNITDRGSGTGSCGAGASTTGNIYGVYDMSGGSYDRVMGYYEWGTESWGSNNRYGNEAGFSSVPDEKYFNAYTTGEMTTACNGNYCYGHALSDSISWYNDDSTYFIVDNFPWIIRGSIYNDDLGGVFSIVRNRGFADYSASFRSVLGKE